MATPTSTSDSETDPQTPETDAVSQRSKRRTVLRNGITANKWSWILAALSLVTAWWLSGHIGNMQGTAYFYIALFLVMAVLAILYAYRDLRRRLKELEYATTR